MAGKRAQELLIALVAAAVVAGAVGGLALLLADSDDAAPAASPPPIALPEPGDTERPPATTPPPVATIPSETHTDAEATTLAPDDATPLPPMGIPTADFDWVSSALPLDAGESWLHQLLEVDGELWAVVAAPEGIGEHTRLFTSSDGEHWARRDLPPALGGDGPAQLWTTDDAVVAMVARWDELGEETNVWVLPHGGNWRQGDLSGVVRDGHHTWLSGVAGGDGLLVAVGATEPMHADGYPPVVVIERDGLVLEIDEIAASYLITDAATGGVVAHGSLDRLWQPEDPESVVIYDPATREPVFTTRWDVLEEAALAAYAEAEFGERLVVEVVTEQLALRLDEFTGALTVSDTAGNVVFGGTEDDLWRGPPPTFSDPRTGEVILIVPWGQWEEAFRAIYEGEQGGSIPLLLRSTDGGATWVAIDAAPDPGDGLFYFNGLVRGPDGFLALGAIETGMDAEASPPQPVILHSPDGQAWTELPGTGSPGWLHQLTQDGDGYLAMLHDEEGPGVVASDDGLSWEVLLRPDDLELPVGTAWFDHVARGPLGTLAAGMWDGWAEPESEDVAIADHGRTLTIAGTIYTVTDDATGEVLITFDERDAWGEGDHEMLDDTGFRWGQGGLALFADDGTVAFAVSHHALEEALEGRASEPAVGYLSETFLVWSDGTGWQRVALPEDLGPNTWCAGLVVHENRVVLATHVDTFYGEGEVDTEVRVLVGTPR